LAARFFEEGGENWTQFKQKSFPFLFVENYSTWIIHDSIKEENKMKARFLRVLGFVICCLFCITCSEKVVPVSDNYFFLAYGNLLKVNPDKQTLSYLFSFHPAAPTVGYSQDGFYWARLGEKSIAAFNPLKEKMEANILLPHRPYNHITTPNNKAYITHHTLTPEGFWISVIDTRKKKLIGTIKHIKGLRSGLAQRQGFVYIATAGVENPDTLFLYEINTRNDHIEEIYKVRNADCYWKISARGNYLYISQINKSKKNSPPSIEVMDIEKKTITQTIHSSQLPGVKEITSKITFTRNHAFMPCRTIDGSPAIGVFNPDLGRIQGLLNVSGHIYKIIGIKDDTLLYIDNPLLAGKRGISLYFYNLRERKEVKIINISKFLRDK